MQNATPPNLQLFNVPNILTLGNLLCGCVAVTLIVNNMPQYAPFAVFIGAVFDFFDGMTARMLKVKSDIGKELDSLADMVTFGIAPSFMMFYLMQQALHFTQPFAELTFWQQLHIYFAFIIAAFSALRLAKFNVDTRQTESFLGLATPSNAVFIGSLILVAHFSDIEAAHHIIANYWFLLGVTIVFSLLLVSEIPMFSFKFKNLSFAHNKIRFFFLALMITLIAILGWLGLSLGMISYIIISIVTGKKSG